MIGTFAVLLMLIRFGMLLLILSAFAERLLREFCVTSDFSAGRAGSTLLAIGVLLVLSAQAIQTAFAGRNLFQENISD